MPEPIEYQILTALQTALAAIAVGSGYHYTLAGSAVKLDPNQAVESLIAPGGPRPFICIEVLPHRWEYFPASQVRLVLPWRLHWIHESDATADASRMQTYFRGVADLERAVGPKTNGTIWHGALASGATISKAAFESEVDGSQVWAMVDLEIIVNRTFGQPDS